MRRGFTLVELLVVIAVIALVIAITVPVYFKVRGNARSTQSMGNLRQWGIGYASFALDNNTRFPWEGFKEANQMPANFATPIWWANAAPQYVGEPTYAELSGGTAADAQGVPLPPRGGIFLDPSAQLPSPLPDEPTFQGWVGGGKRFYFNYVPNAELNNHLDKPSIPELERRVRMSHLKSPANTVLMLEMRSVPEELLSPAYPTPGAHPFYNEQLNRHMADWQRLAARHSDGGHVLFADGSVRWVMNADACTTADGEFGNFSEKDYNKAWLIWDPLGPTNEAP